MTIKHTLAATALAVALGALQCGSAYDDEAMKSGSMMSTDCSTANDQMMKMAMPTAMSGDAMSAPKPDASVDKHFMAAMHDAMEHQMALAKLEVKCGKDPKAKSEAQKLIDMLSDYTKEAMQIEREIP